MRILIYRLGSLGDTVLALPCFRLIRETYPGAEITVLTNAPISAKAAPLESILESSGLIDAVIPYPVGLRDVRQLGALRSRLRALRFDLLISLTAARGFAASVRDTIFFKTCGIPKLIGIPFRTRDLVCERLRDSVLYEPEAERLLRRVKALGTVDLRDPRWVDLGLTAGEQSAAGRLLAEAGVGGRFIAASLGTKTPLKDWGAANWTRLLSDLSRSHPELGVVLLGSGDETARSEALLAGWRGPRANLCGKATPRVSAAVLERAALYVGHDSGPMHLAAAAGTRCVTIHSAYSRPGQWFPLGEGHINFYPYAFYDPRETENLAYQQQALNSIGVDAVLAAVEGALPGSGA